MQEGHDMKHSDEQRAAVCSWSLRAAGPAELAERLRAVGLMRVQLALDPLRRSEAWADAPRLLAEAGVEVVSGMFGCAGEDYSTLESIRRTGGLAPDATWEENWRNIRANAELAGRMGVALVTFHAGFVSEDAASKEYAKLLDRIGRVADAFAAAGCAIALETGQEDAATLRALLDTLGRGEVGVNFDPANMILYGKGDPVAAVATLGPFIRQVHVKDAVPTATPGTWGREVAAGRGAVDWPAFFAALAQAGFGGDFCIEREAREERTGDIIQARELIARHVRRAG